MSSKFAILRRFAGNDRGNVAMLFALSCLAIFPLVGFAIDLSRVMVEKHKLQQATDAAALAAYNGAAVMAESTPAAPPQAGARGTRVRKVAAFDELSVLGWDNRRQVMVVSFRERGPQGQRARRLTRQYWAREAGHWKILSQDPSA